MPPQTPDSPLRQRHRPPQYPLGMEHCDTISSHDSPHPRSRPRPQYVLLTDDATRPRGLLPIPLTSWSEVTVEWYALDGAIPWKLIFVVGEKILHSTRMGWTGTWMAHCMNEETVVFVRLVVGGVAPPWPYQSKALVFLSTMDSTTA